MPDVSAIIRKKAAQYGVDPTLALAFAQIESGLNPAPKTGNGGGLYQLDADNWKQFGNGASITDPTANADAFMRYFKGKLQPGMEQGLGRPATPGELYLGHQQGVAGANALLAHPNDTAADTLSGFYPNVRTATSAITSNGGDPDATGQQFASMWNSKLDAAAKNFDPNWAGSGSAIIGSPQAPPTMMASAAPAAAATTPGTITTTASGQKQDPYKGLLSSGMQLAEAGAPSGPRAPMPMPQAGVHQPNPMYGLLDPNNPLSTPILSRNQQQEQQLLQRGLLGIV